MTSLNDVDSVTSPIEPVESPAAILIDQSPQLFKKRTLEETPGLSHKMSNLDVEGVGVESPKQDDKKILD